MNKYYTLRDQTDILIELVKTLNIGNTASPHDRVYLAKEQLLQLDATVKELRNSKCFK